MDYRIEHDSMGEVRVPADRLWAAQTQRSHENFEIGVGLETMPREITHAFGILKKAAAIANHALKPEKMTDKKLDAIKAACDEVISGSLNDHFPLVVWQTGSGTQSNLNANEVIANRGHQIAGEKRLHPNDDSNRNMPITMTNCTATGTVTVVNGATATIGGFAGEAERGTFNNCSTTSDTFIGKVWDGYTLNDDGNGKLTVTKN